jgi:iron complex transport system permease protein
MGVPEERAGGLAAVAFPEASGPEGRARWSLVRNLGLLAAALLALLVFSPLLGDVPIPSAAVIAILVHGVALGGGPGPPCGPGTISGIQCAAWSEIVWGARLPEILLAVVVGAALGTSGATLQGVFRNPLADPYLLGLSSGAAFGAAVLFVFRVGLSDADLTLPLFAFVGALFTGMVVLAAARSPRSSVTTLLLTGVALSAFFSALLVVALLYNVNGSLQVSYWLLGGLYGASWTRDGIAFGGVLIAGALQVLYGRDLNLLQLGRDVAQSLGVDARRARLRLILLSSVSTAFAVAFAGIIGFVGLIAPHVVRRLVGFDYRIVLPASAIVGAAFVLSARDLALVLFPGTEVPVGVPMAFAGTVFFLYLLYRRRGPAGSASSEE